MISYFYRGKKDKELQKSKVYRKGSWIYVTNPTQEELDFLCLTFTLEKDLLNDAMDPNEVPRMEEEGDVIYVFVQAPLHLQSLGTTTHPVLMVVSPDFILTLSRSQVDFLEPFLKNKQTILTTQRTKILIQFWFALNDAYTRHLARIGKELRKLSSDVQRVRVEDITRFVAYEKTASDFLVSLVPMRAIVQSLLSEKHLRLYEEDRDLVEDLFLAMGQLIETSRSTHRHVVNIRESSSVIMTYHLNASIRTLTILTIVLSIPMILASFYGMNVALPFESAPWMFGAVIGISLFAMGISFAFLFRK